jgi:hypothetical protein
VSEFPKRHSLQIEPHALPQLTDARHGRPSRFLLEATFLVRERVNGGIDEFVHRPD